MSVLICSLCEQNREPVSNAVTEAIQNLGRKAAGKSEFLATCICDKCGLRQKKFVFSIGVDSLPAVSYLVQADQEGNYVVEIEKEFMLNQKEINWLHLINLVKAQLDSLTISDARGCRIFMNQQVHVSSNTQPNSLVKCICGNNTFSNSVPRHIETILTFTEPS